MLGRPRPLRAPLKGPSAHDSSDPETGLDASRAFVGLASTVSLAEKNPLTVRFNPPNDINQPILLFLRVDDVKRELLFSKAPAAEREKCARIVSLKSCSSIECKSKDEFKIVLNNAPPITLIAHDAFVRAPPPNFLLFLVPFTRTRAYDRRASEPCGRRASNGCSSSAR